jgi:hypothetical protein
MPTPETAELLKRAEQLRLQLAAPADEENEAALEEALETLRRLAGRPSLASERAKFERTVARTIQALPGVVVADRPRSGGVKGEADFFVKSAGRTFLIEAKAPGFFSRGSLTRTLARLEHLTDAFGADQAFLVVPKRPAPITSDDDRVSVVTVSELRDMIMQASTKSEVIPE